MTHNDSLLREGIAAAKLGQRERARTLLMQVVEADERSELGWLWLSAVVDEPSDQRVCLENVLDINPRNQQALKGLAWLDAHHPVVVSTPEPLAARAVADSTTVAAPAERAPTPTLAAPAGPTAADIAIPPGPLPHVENPCPFCGAPTRLDQQRCVQCKNSLLVRDAPNKRRSLPTTLLALFWELNGVLVLASVGIAVLMFLGRANTPGLEREQQQILESWREVSSIVIPLGVLFGVLYIVLGVGLWRRQRWAFITSCALLGVSVVTFLFNAASLLRADIPSTPNVPTQTVQTVVYAVVMCGFLFVALLVALSALGYRDFFGKMVRVITAVPDRDDDDHYNMGVAYKDRGMWYMAAKEWEGAVKRRPGDADYRRALGLAYAQIRQLGRGVRELREALRLRQNDQRIKDDLALVEGLALKELRGQ